jgi:dTMP kinase
MAALKFSVNLSRYFSNSYRTDIEIDKKRIMLMTNKGFFLTLEGVEGTGKSTLTKLLSSDFEKDEIPFIATREPGGSSIGKIVRSLILDSSSPDLTPKAEALLFAADRSQHVHEIIRPALEAGKVVLCDRYSDSSAAYQGVGKELGDSQVRHLSLWGTDALKPDLTILVDLDPVIGISRKSEEEYNRMEAQDIEFHQKIRRAFLNMASRDKRFFVIDGTLPIAEVHRLAKEEIYSRLKTHNLI